MRSSRRCTRPSAPGGMIRVPNPHAPAVLSRFDEEINRRARAECTTADVIIERALIHYLRSA